MKKIIFLLAMFFTISAYSQSGVIEDPKIPKQSGNAGKYLKTNGSKMSWATVPTPTYAPGVSAALTGSGTVGYLPMYSSANTFTNGVISQSSLNVGIGTSSPTAKLHVMGEGYFYNSESQYARIGGNQPAIYMNSENYLAINSGGFGGVNIGANSVGVQLLSGIYNLRTNTTGIGSLVSYNVSDYMFKSYVDSDINKFIINHFGFYGKNYLGVNIDPTANLHVKGTYTTSATYAVKIDDANSSSLMSIRNDGNVGIGTSSPTAKLQVVGLVEYADNAAAITAGLTVGAFYRTGDLLKVVH